MVLDPLRPAVVRRLASFFAERHYSAVAAYRLASSTVQRRMPLLTFGRLTQEEVDAAWRIFSEGGSKASAEPPLGVWQSAHGVYAIQTGADGHLVYHEALADGRRLQGILAFDQGCSCWEASISIAKHNEAGPSVPVGRLRVCLVAEGRDAADGSVEAVSQVLAVGNVDWDAQELVRARRVTGSQQCAATGRGTPAAKQAPRVGLALGVGGFIEERGKAGSG